jgi:broad specificity phosphatase PhoE
MEFGLTTIYLVRHGDKSALIEKFKDLDSAAIFSSNIEEAKTVAQTIANKKNLQIETSKDLNKPTEKTLEKDFDKFIKFMQEKARDFEDKTIIIITHGTFLRKFLVTYKYGTEKEFAPGSVARGGYLKLESNGHDFFATETYKIHLIEEK